MTFQVRVEKRANSFGLDDRVWVLDDGQGSFVEVAPALGFNAYRWHVPQGELLYAAPNYFEENKPTRSGFPILFPFPNRIRGGRFTWNGKDYQLPTKDPSGKNAIHGFVCHRPWRVVAQGADGGAAWVTGNFVGSKDAPDTLDLWPADYSITVTYRLGSNKLEVLAEVANPGQTDLPFGLGYHPYFALSLFGGPAAMVSIRARQYWELVDSLPTGQRFPEERKYALRDGQRYDQLHLDDVFTDLDRPATSGEEALTGLVSHEKRRLEMRTSDIFREIVGFTPPHRQAICLEPYTCTTDAINLQARGVDAGWRTLKPGMSVRGRIELKASGEW
jgi:aldose 1-epimerase